MKREIIAVNVSTGEKRHYPDTGVCAADLGTTRQNIMQQLNRNGMVGLWRLYDTQETLTRRIFELQRLIKEIESL